MVTLILTSAVNGGEWSASRSGCFTTGEGALGVLWLGGWVVCRADRDPLGKTKICYSCRESSHFFSYQPVAEPLFGLRYLGCLHTHII